MKDEEAKKKEVNGGPGTTEEKAQYEVFSNGSLKRATLEKWIRIDIESAMSFLHAARTDDMIFKAVCDAFEKRYQKLHAKQNEDDTSSNSSISNPGNR